MIFLVVIPGLADRQLRDPVDARSSRQPNTTTQPHPPPHPTTHPPPPPPPTPGVPAPERSSYGLLPDAGVMIVAGMDTPGGADRRAGWTPYAPSAVHSRSARYSFNRGVSGAGRELDHDRAQTSWSRSHEAAPGRRSGGCQLSSGELQDVVLV